MELLKTIAGICGSITTIIALVTLIVKPIRHRLADWIMDTTGKKNMDRKIDNLTELVEKQIKQGEDISAEIDKLKMAEQATLRNSILTIYNTRMKLKYMTLYERQNVAKLYEQYIALNGNSFVHDCVEELEKLPIKDD